MLEQKNGNSVFLFSATCFIAMILLANSSVQLNNKEEELEELEREKLSIEEDTKSKEKVIEKLSNEANELDDSVKEQQKEIKKLEKTNKKLNNNIDEKKKELDKQNKELDEKNKEIENLKHLSKKKENNPQSNTVSDDKNLQVKDTVKMNVTAYTSSCKGCIGITYKGTNVKNTIYHPSGYKIAAVDPNFIPLGTLLQVNGETYIADDTGGAIKGNRLDLLMETKEQALSFGRQSLNVKILN